MFLPYSIEKVLTKSHSQQVLACESCCNFFGALLVHCWSGFISRAYTVHHLPLEPNQPCGCDQNNKRDLISLSSCSRLCSGSWVLDLKAGNHLENKKGHRLLAYFHSINYVMRNDCQYGEGMELFEQHKTLGMITEYIFHPFAHLTVVILTMLRCRLIVQYA